MVAEKPQPNWATTLLAQVAKSGVDVAEEVRGFGVHGNVEHHGAVQTTTLAMPRVVQPANIPTGVHAGLISRTQRLCPPCEDFNLRLLPWPRGSCT
jgi:hypothetical protein